MLLLTSGIPLGMVTIIGGAILLFATQYKVAGKIAIGIGGALVILFFILMLLAFLSQV